VLERGHSGRRYLMGGENLTLVGLLETLSEVTGIPVPRRKVCYHVGSATAYLNSSEPIMSPGEHPITVTGVCLVPKRSGCHALVLSRTDYCLLP
jgi:dihydroflavonol-4-reductase